MNLSHKDKSINDSLLHYLLNIIQLQGHLTINLNLGNITGYSFFRNVLYHWQPAREICRAYRMKKRQQ